MKYMIIGLFLLFAGNIYAQVRGTVKDSTGEAIPGANVFWMNTGQGVTTKEDGSFSITKPSKSHMLIVSFIGFQNDTIHVSSKNQQLDIVLRDGVELNEVNIVTRKLGTMKLRSSVMNEDMISSAELSRAACCNLGESFLVALPVPGHGAGEPIGILTRVDATFSSGCQLMINAIRKSMPF